jgi:hypothetical protein
MHSKRRHASWVDLLGGGLAENSLIRYHIGLRSFSASAAATTGDAPKDLIIANRRERHANSKRRHHCPR